MCFPGHGQMKPEQLGLTLLLRLLGSGFPAGTLIVHRRLGQER